MFSSWLLMENHVTIREPILTIFSIKSRTSTIMSSQSSLAILTLTFTTTSKERLIREQSQSTIMIKCLKSLSNDSMISADEMINSSDEWNDHSHPFWVKLITVINNGKSETCHVKNLTNILDGKHLHYDILINLLKRYQVHSSYFLYQSVRC